MSNNNSSSVLENESNKASKESTYKYGFSSNLDQEVFEAGLNEGIVRQISAQNNEPKWLLDYRLKAFAFWCKSTQPNWAKLNIDPIDYQSIRYFAGVKKTQKSLSFKEIKEDWLSKFG